MGNYTNPSLSPFSSNSRYKMENAGQRVGSLLINAGANVQGKSGKPVSVFVSKGEAMKTLGRTYDSSLSYQRQKMRTNAQHQDYGKSDEQMILEGQARMNARWHAGFEQPGLRAAMAQYGITPEAATKDKFGKTHKGTRTLNRAGNVIGPTAWKNSFEGYVDRRGDLHTVQRPRKFKYDSRTYEGKIKRFLHGRGPDPRPARPIDTYKRIMKKGSNYEESGDSRDKTKMSIKTFEGIKSFKNKTADKKTSPGRVFSAGTSQVKRSKSAGKKEGRT